MHILFVVKDSNVEHLGIMLFARLVKGKGHTVSVVPAAYRSIKRELRKNPAAIVAYSAPSMYFEEYRVLNRRIKKEFSVFSVFGGSHPTFVPDVIEAEGIDCVCRGEGEFAFLELIEKLAQGQPLSGIENLWVKESGRIYRNAVRPLIENLDQLPFPDRKVFPHAETFTKGKMHVITSRGCPFDCSYCCHPALGDIYGPAARRIRRRSVANVLAEIHAVACQTRLKLIMFEDDLFVLDQHWIHEFADRYQKEIKIPFFCYVRANCITQTVVEKLKKAGCVGMSMGIETADDSVRNSILKRAMTQAEIRNAAHLIKAAGIRLEGMNIVGIPGSTIEHDFATLKLNVACGVDYASAKLLMPYPHTEIRAYAAERGVLNEGYSHWHSSIRFTDVRMKRGIENLRLLFGVAVEFPILIPMVKRIIYWPLGFLYRIIHVMYEGVIAYIRLYPTGIRGLWWGIYKYLIIFKNTYKA